MPDQTAETSQTQPEPTVIAPGPPADAKSLIQGWKVPAIAGAAGLVLGLILGLGINGVIDGIDERAKESAAAEEAAASRTILPDAVRLCAADREYAVEGDDGLSLTIDNKGDEDYLGGLSTSDMMCIFERLDAPTAVIAHMQQTTSMDGRQTEDWDNIEVSWSYHPDRGMDSVVTVTE